jgi:ABC-type phosphate transport system auxiliary subunit
MRKKMIEEVRKASDRTEIETVAKKLNEVRLECDQLKTGVKLSGEKVAVMEESRRKLIQNLKQLADEINAGLDEVKAQGETNKTGMNPTAYMAIQNAATRMGNTIAQRFQVLSDSLK